MGTMISKVLVIILILAGEILACYAEIFGARSNYVSSRPFLQIFLKMFLLWIIAGGFLLLGYMLGLNAFKNIYVVSVISITCVLIVEPSIGWIAFHQLPTTGAIIGFIFGVLGFLAAIFL